MTSSVFGKIIWNVWAPGKIKMFAWLMLQNKLWCNDRLQRHGWKNENFCQLCTRNLESSKHLFWECPMAKGVWETISSWTGCASLALAASWRDLQHSSIALAALDRSAPRWRKGTNTLLLLVCWEIWQERNNATFRKSTPRVSNIIRRVTDCIELWRAAGATCIESPFGEPP